MTDNPDFERRLAEQAVRIFAEEWVLAISPVLQTLQDDLRMKTDERRNFLRSNLAMDLIVCASMFLFFKRMDIVPVTGAEEVAEKL